MIASQFKPLMSSGKDDWETPDKLFNFYNSIYNFVLDAAANELNHKTPEWLGPGGIVEDALTTSWKPWLLKGNIWLNPPYSRGLQAAFVKKAAIEAMHEDLTHSVVVLLPARTDTKLFHGWIWNRPNVEVTFIKGRIKFKGALAGAPFPSMVVVFS